MCTPRAGKPASIKGRFNKSVMEDQTDNELKTAYGQIDNVITTAEAADDAHGSKYDKLSSALNDIRTSILSNEVKHAHIARIVDKKLRRRQVIDGFHPKISAINSMKNSFKKDNSKKELLMTNIEILNQRFDDLCQSFNINNDHIEIDAENLPPPESGMSNS